MALRLRASDIIAIVRLRDGAGRKGLLRSKPPTVKIVKHRVRSPGRWLAISCLISWGCTKLEDPNQLFGNVVAGSGGELSGGNAGRGGESQAGVGGVKANPNANAGAAALTPDDSAGDSGAAA